MRTAQQVVQMRLLAAMLSLLGLLAAFILAAPRTAAQAAEKRLALIIANDAYVSAGLGALPGVRIDVDLMQPALRAAGFDVSVARNLHDKSALQKAVSDFAMKLADAGPNTVAFIYYSGHGVSDARRGQNFLIPTSAELRTLADLPLQALPLNDLLDAVESAGVKMAMVVADACRDTPVSLSRGTKGFVAERSRSDMLVAFATSPGETATDDNIYARTLAAELVRPGASSRTLFTDTQTAVARATGRRQIPEFRSLLVEHVVFVPEPAPAATVSTAQTATVTTPPPAAEQKPEPVAAISTAPVPETTVPPPVESPVLRIIEERTLVGPTRLVESATFSPDSERIVTASRDDTARIWDVATGRVLHTLTGHSGIVLGAAFSPDGARIVTASADKTARIWDVATGRSLRTLPQRRGQETWVYDAEFSPDGRRVVTADDPPHIFDLATGRLLTLTGHSGTVATARFSPDGERVVTASVDNTARIWDVATGQTLFTLTGHSHHVNSAVFSPDGARVVTASLDRTARIWNAATGQTFLTLTGHTAPISNAAFSPDGTRIVTASVDNTARIWDVATGQTIFTLTGHTALVSSAAFSPDGARIVTASWDNTVKIWRIEE